MSIDGVPPAHRDELQEIYRDSRQKVYYVLNGIGVFLLLSSVFTSKYGEHSTMEGFFISISFVLTLQVSNFMAGFTGVGIGLSLYVWVMTSFFAFTQFGFLTLNVAAMPLTPIYAGILAGPEVAFIATVMGNFMFFVFYGMEVFLGYSFPMPFNILQNRQQNLIQMGTTLCVVMLLVPYFEYIRNTPLKRLQNVAEQSRKSTRAMVEATKQARDSLATYSHEVRTPLNVIHAMAESLARGGDEEPEQQRVLLRLLQSSAQSLLLIANNVLDIAAISAGALTIERTVFDLHAMLDQAAVATSLAGSHRNVALFFKKSSNIPRRVVGDEVRLRQALHNVLDHALRRSVPGSTISFDVSLASTFNLSFTEGGPGHSVTVLFAITDEGSALSEAQRNTLFSKISASEQSDAPADALDGGPRTAALGLYISRKLVKAFKGALQETCEKGFGSTITLGIPFEVVSTPDIAAKELRLLYADDEPSNQFVMRTLLQGSGHVVDTASNGYDAVQLSSTVNYDVILLDVEMPRMTGFEAASAIRAFEKRSKSPHVPVIFVSAAHMTQAECQTCGGDAALSKPLSKSQLLHVLNITSHKDMSTSEAGILLTDKPRSRASSTDTHSSDGSLTDPLGEIPLARIKIRLRQILVFLKPLFSPSKITDHVRLWQYRIMIWVWSCVLGYCSISTTLDPSLTVPNAGLVIAFGVYPLLLIYLPNWAQYYTPIQAVITRSIFAFSRAGFDSLTYHICYHVLIVFFVNGSTLTAIGTSLVIFVHGVIIYNLHDWYTFPIQADAEYIRSTLIIMMPTVLTVVGIWVVWSEWARLVSYRVLTETARQLQRSQRKIERKRTATENFAAIVSYDIRTPLNVVLGITERLSAEPQLSSSTRHAVAVMDTAAGMLLHLIGNMLDASAVDAGSKFPMESAPTDIRGLASRVASMMSFYARAKQLRMCLKLGRFLPKYVLSDPSRLQQVLVNLVTNAVKFTETGFVRLTVTRADISNEISDEFDTTSGVTELNSPVDTRSPLISPRGEAPRFGRPGTGTLVVPSTLKKERPIPTNPDSVALHFEVEDTGPGIAEDQKLKLFAQFAAGISQQTRPKGGAGLGLFISRAIVQEMGSTIRVRSKVNVGTTFSFTCVFPTVATPGEAAIRRDSFNDEIWDQALRVLVIEDAMEMQYIIQLFFGGTPHQVEMATSGAEACSMFATTYYDVVLVDLHLPDMSGLDVVRKLRSAEIESAASMVVAVTADTSELAQRSAIAAGCDEFVSKPLTRDRLFRVLRSAGDVISNRVKREGSSETVSISSPLLAEKTETSAAELLRAHMRRVSETTHGTSLQLQTTPLQLSPKGIPALQGLRLNMDSLPSLDLLSRVNSSPLARQRPLSVSPTVPNSPSVEVHKRLGPRSVSYSAFSFESELKDARLLSSTPPPPQMTPSPLPPRPSSSMPKPFRRPSSIQPIQPEPTPHAIGAPRFSTISAPLMNNMPVSDDRYTTMIMTDSGLAILPPNREEVTELTLAPLSKAPKSVPHFVRPSSQTPPSRPIFQSAAALSPAARFDTVSPLRARPLSAEPAVFSAAAVTHTAPPAQEAVSVSPPPLDLVLDEVVVSVPTEYWEFFQTSLKDRYKEDVAEMVLAVRRNTNEDDAKVRASAHRIKGSAATFGMVAMGELTNAIMRIQDHGLLAAKVDELETLMSRMVFVMSD